MSFYPISDTFDDPLGRWEELAPWDTNLADAGDTGYLSTQSHVDVRNFRPLGTRKLTMADLDLRTQTEMDVPQTELEFESLYNTENWVLSGTGVNTLEVGLLTGRHGWSGLTVSTTGASINASLTSSTSNPIDISAMTDISVIFPDYNSFDTTSYIQFTSDPAGVFGNGFDSTQVTFASNLSTMPQVKLAVSAFAHSGFVNTGVTGVLIHLNESSAPSSGETVTVMAIRAITSAWEEAAYDFDTLFGQVVVPVTTDGNVYGGSTAEIPLIRGDKSKNDPIPADGAISITFDLGGQVSPASGMSYNTLDIIFREIFDTDAGTESYIGGQLQWNSDGTVVNLYTYDYASSTPTQTTIITDDTLGTLTPGLTYIFTISFQGTSIVARIDQSDSSGVIEEFVWQSQTYTNAAFPYRNGRVGFFPAFVDRDTAISAFESAATGFAQLTSKTYPQRTPVDGLQLAAVYSPDLNLWDSFSAPDLYIDQTKTISGLGSFRSAIGLTSNTFIVDDWTQTYLSFSIWVPSSTTLNNQPVANLITPDGPLPIFIPQLKPGQWNSVLVDLGVYRGNLTAQGYYITITAAPAPNKYLGYFWVDEMLVGRRRVSWKGRATINGPFRDFWGNVNDPNKALHFIPEERGTQVQIQAEALTDDAWISQFYLFPRHSEPGYPLWQPSPAS